MSDPFRTRVFEDTSADLFQSGRVHVLVFADRLSGWPVIHRWMKDSTAREVTLAIIGNFVDLGVPVRQHGQRPAICSWYISAGTA